MQIQFRVQGFYQCWAGTSLESWNIHWYWYQRTNQTAIYDLRQDQPRTNTCLVGTWGNTYFILSLYRSQYQVHTCLIWGKNQPWTLIPWPACYVFLLKNNPPPIPGWYHIFFGKRSNISTNLVCSKTHYPHLTCTTVIFTMVSMSVLVDPRHFFEALAGSVFKRDVQTIYVETNIGRVYGFRHTM